MNQPKVPESISLPDSWRSKPFLLVAVGAVLIVGGLGLCFLGSGSSESGAGIKYFFHSYLANFIYALSFGLGATFFVLIQFLCRAGWSASIRRMAELISTTIPWMAVLFIPILVLVFAQSPALYEWNRPVSELHGLTALKGDYLNAPFFVARSVFYFVCWILMATWFYRTSRKQDESGDVGLTTMLQKWSGPMVMAYALTVSFAAFDWVMSIDSDWYSTIFGVYIFAAGMYGFFALMICIFLALQNQGKLRDNVTVEHFHDMGKFLFGFTMFWAYIAFSQMMLYWYGNIPEETAWYRQRLQGGWEYLSYGLIIIHFILPWLGTVSRHVRRHRSGLLFWAAWGLVAHWLDMTYLVLPNAGPATGLVLLAHLMTGLGMTSIFLAFLLIRASDVPLIAIRDPRLHEAMSYTNPIL